MTLPKRGRPSASDLSTKINTVTSLQRASPPDYLTDEQAAEWNSVVERMPPDWFPRETHLLLAQYCRHKVTAARVSQLIEGEDNEAVIDIDRYNKLLGMQERESRAIASLATKMRISQQTFFDKEKKRGTQVEKPWE